MTKEFILAEIKRVGTVNGKSIGHKRFSNETGIQMADWYGKYWVRWSDALKDAGLSPNEFNKAYSDEFVIEKLISLIRELGHYPVIGEIRIKAREDKSFPAHNVFNRVGNRQTLIKKLAAFCGNKSQYADIVQICSELKFPGNLEKEKDYNLIIGAVYLIKSGKFYKIGRSNSTGRRHYELAIQLPETAEVIHSINTDDPVGIEAYWHNRFSEKRKNGEWFELNQNDINAFKRRKFM
ncbi:GIY-YIG nuclease family protein [Niabella beijingensis]|uniref:GIY-YIG nuclease family protein n=1 Tax=Niabella beijingensis TaxID=2872700 RepID=UPI001CBDC5A5|nr:GIY-YIG nuclease family protein [Niabella beijingensis]MBZ4191568.1 GIY-YIG nuclease family protein [Niabella beijingensis]